MQYAWAWVLPGLWLSSAHNKSTKWLLQLPFVVVLAVAVAVTVTVLPLYWNSAKSFRIKKLDVRISQKLPPHYIESWFWGSQTPIPPIRGQTPTRCAYSYLIVKCHCSCCCFHCKLVCLLVGLLLPALIVIKVITNKIYMQIVQQSAQSMNWVPQQIILKYIY